MNTYPVTGHKIDVPVPTLGIYARLTRDEGRLLWQTFRLPPELPFPATLLTALQEFNRYCQELAPPPNTYHAHQQDLLDLALNQLGRLCVPGEPVQPPLDRHVLHNYLTEFSFIATLLLLATVSEPVPRSWWFLLLARAYLYLGCDAYRMYLAMDHAREAVLRANAQQVLEQRMNLQFLTDAAAHELRSALLRLAEELGLPEFSILARSLTAPRSASRPLFSGDSTQVVRQSLVCAGGEELTLHSRTDTDGEGYRDWVSVEPAITWTPDQASRHYQRQQTGLRNALRRANLRLPLTHGSLTPAECSQIFGQPPLNVFRTGTWSQLDKALLAQLTLLWLRLWSGRSAQAWLEVELINLGARTGSPADVDDFPEAVGYQLDRQEGCYVGWFGPRQLVEGKVPSTGLEKLYHSTPRVVLPLGWPLQSLFNRLLRSVQPLKRQQVKLGQLLGGLSAAAHEEWLRELCQQLGDATSVPVTPAALVYSFHHFAGSRVPETFLAFLHGQGVVQSHYVNVSQDRLQYTLQKAWRVWLKALRLLSLPDSSSETDLGLDMAHSYHRHAGSGLRVRLEVLDTLLAHLAASARQWLSSLQDAAASWQPEQLEPLSELLALYLHVRLSVTMALRPVNTPHPPLSQLALASGVLSVIDKNSHHNNGHRLLVLDPALAQLWQTWQQWFRRCSHWPFDREPHALMVFEQQSWQSLSRKQVSRLLRQVGLPLDPGTFRHVAASEWIDSERDGRDFSQRAVNTLMNHNRRGEGVLGSWSLLSLSRIAAEQQLRLARNPALLQLARHDELIAALLDRLTGHAGGGD